MVDISCVARLIFINTTSNTISTTITTIATNILEFKVLVRGGYSSGIIRSQFLHLKVKFAISLFQNRIPMALIFQVSSISIWKDPKINYFCQAQFQFASPVPVELSLALSLIITNHPHPTHST